jgi:hypothetical protein
MGVRKIENVWQLFGPYQSKVICGLNIQFQCKIISVSACNSKEVLTLTNRKSPINFAVTRGNGIRFLTINATVL